MNSENILLQKKDGVAKIIINKPPLNILTVEDMLEMSEALEQLKTDDQIKVVVITGAGKRAFSAGVEFKDHLGDRQPKMLEAYDKLLTSLLEVDKVTVAVVNGIALAMPCEVIAFCDIAIASEKAQIGVPHVKFGCFPPVGSVLFPRLIGRKKAFELILSGDSIDGREAERIGLVNKAVPEEELEKATDDFVNRFLAYSGEALTLARRIVYRNFDVEFSKARKMTWIDIAASLVSETAVEGFTAAIEKRAPLWRSYP